MDYEQKYNAALGRAKEKYSACSAPALLEYIFPELKESEDERIKREILELVSIAGNGNQFEEIKDWLEKQGEKFTAIDVDIMVMEYSHTKDGDFGLPVNCMTRAYRKGINDALKVKQSNTLDTYKVIEWLNDQACLGWIEDVQVEKFVDKFKKDFEL